MVQLRTYHLPTWIFFLATKRLDHHDWRPRAGLAKGMDLGQFPSRVTAQMGRCGATLPLDLKRFT